MRVPSPSVSLRPLGVGEILDRAVNLCVRFFAPLATIYVVYGIPLGITTFFSTQSLSRVMAVLGDAGRASGNGVPSADRLSQAFQATPFETIVSVLALLAIVFVSPLATGALIEATTAFYLGRTSSFKQAYRVALDRYWNMLGVTLLFSLTGIVFYLLVVIVAVVLVLGFIAIGTAAKTAAIVGAIVVGGIVGIAAIAVALVFLLTLQIAYFSCIVERANFTAAYGRSVKRTFRGIGLKRTLLVGLIYVAIALGISLVSLAGEATIVSLLHSPILATVYETIVRVATAAFTTAFIAAFYLDLRVREEGLDLQLAAEGAPPQTNIEP